MANSRDSILNLFPDNNQNEITALKIRQFVTAIFDEEIDINEIQNRLDSTDVDKPLSANQGRVLDIAINAVDIDLNTKEDNLPSGSSGEILSLDSNLDKVWITPQTFTETTVVDNLLSTSSTDALSANQGRVLDVKIATESSINTSQNSLIATNITDISDLAIIVGDNEADILTNIGNIANNSTSISTNIGRINDNVTSIGTLNTLTGQHTIAIAQNASAIIDVDGRVDISNINI